MGTRRLGVGIAVALIVAIAAPGTTAVAATGAKKPVPPPEHWDPRIAKIAKFVERDRELEFEHPVPVQFLSDEAFKRKVRTDEEDVTDEDREDAAEIAGQLHALGLIGADVDLIQASSDLDEVSIVGYYDTEREVMVVRGKDLSDLEVRVTVAHELTHALQDQHFNIDKLYNNTETSGGAFALDALIEGDAVLVENDFVGTLSSAEQDEYYGEGPTEGDVPVEEPLPEGVPVALDVFSTVPYVLGPSFAYLLYSAGSKELDRAFEDPPVTDEEIMDPAAWEQHEHPLRVPAPELARGEKKVGPPDEFGAFTLYLMLAARTDLKTAMRATTGWGGDRYRGFERDGLQCVRADFVGDTDRDTQEIQDALDAWAASLPAGMATVERNHGRVELTSCEDDSVVPPEASVLEDAVYNVLDLRLTLAAEFVSGFDASAKQAGCAADRMVVDPDLRPVLQRLYFEGARFKALTDDEKDLFYTRSGRALAACNVDLQG